MRCRTRPASGTARALYAARHAGAAALSDVLCRAQHDALCTVQRLQSLISSVVTTTEECIMRTQFNELGGLLLQAPPKCLPPVCPCG
jgi:hypothetical protein